ncbi:hypothetical protein [Palleronia sp. LCG004]|uniref:hypothetical protein n=1 Tax=Palleronia sp. LCG004 TaxID=3079304 RepID=UPI002942286B|nr:hypothetical protein [Palleronia sp. LCG004]WOI55110.1 hypothetical protein RVY76_08550 [Palleronia sp. LCG004]
MGRKIVMAALLVVATAACEREADRQRLATEPQAVAIDPRPLIAEIVSVAAEPAPSGVILRATGRAPVQGYYQGALLPVPSAPGSLTFQFRAAQPTEAGRVSTPRSREVTVALALDTEELAGISELRVSGATNALAVRR